MLSEESNKMSRKILSQDSNFEDNITIEDCIKAVIEAADDYDKLVGG